MRRRVHLHVGLGKTGTTSIQQTFFRSRRELRTRGIVYPNIRSNHVSLIYALSEPTASFTRWQVRTGVTSGEAWRDKAEWSLRRLQEATEDDWDDLVISAEKFSDLDVDQLRALRALFTPYADDLNVIVYFRDPLAWAASAVQQMLRAGWRLTEAIQEAQPPPFEDVATKLNDAFGRETVQIRLFDKAVREPGGLVSDFCAAIGRPDVRDILEGVRVNASAGVSELLILDRLNALRPVMVDGEVNRERALHLAARIRRDGPAADFSGAIMRARADAMRSSYDWLHATIPDASEYCPFPSSIAESDFVSEGTRDAAFDAACELINDVTLWGQMQQADALAFSAMLAFRDGDRARAVELARQALVRNPAQRRASALLRKLEAGA